MDLKTFLKIKDKFPKAILMESNIVQKKYNKKYYYNDLTESLSKYKIKEINEWIKEISFLPSINKISKYFDNNNLLLEVEIITGQKIDFSVPLNKYRSKNYFFNHILKQIELSI